MDGWMDGDDAIASSYYCNRRLAEKEEEIKALNERMTSDMYE
jgi:hypothetical protein